VALVRYFTSTDMTFSFYSTNRISSLILAIAMTESFDCFYADD